MTFRDDSPIGEEPELRRKTAADLARPVAKSRNSRFEIAKAIIEARLERRWTQSDLAREAGTKQSRISELESARGNPTIETVERVAAVLGLELQLRPQSPIAVHSYQRQKQTLAPILIYCSAGFGTQQFVHTEKFTISGLPATIEKRIGRASAQVKIA